MVAREGLEGALDREEMTVDFSQVGQFVDEGEEREVAETSLTGKTGER